MSDTRHSGESRQESDVQTTTTDSTRRDALRLLAASAATGAISSTTTTATDGVSDHDENSDATSPWRLPGVVEASAAGVGHTVAETPLATLRTPLDSRGYVGVVDDDSDPITLRLSVDGTADARLDLAASFGADRAALLADRLDAGTPVEVRADDALLDGGGEVVTVTHFGDGARVGAEYVGDGEVTLYVEVDGTDGVTRADAGVSLDDGATEIAAGLRRAVARRGGDQ